MPVARSVGRYRIDVLHIVEPVALTELMHQPGARPLQVQFCGGDQGALQGGLLTRIWTVLNRDFDSRLTLNIAPSSFWVSDRASISLPL